MAVEEQVLGNGHGRPGHRVLIVDDSEDNLEPEALSRIIESPSPG